MVRAAVVAAAIAYVGYLALLITCDLLRVTPMGFVPRFGPGAGIVSVTNLQPGSPAAAAGLMAGDRLRRVNGQELAGRVDWERVRAHLDPNRPVSIHAERGGRSLSVTFSLSTEGPGSARQRPALFAFRAAQVVTLVFSLLVAFRRIHQPTALLGAGILAAMSTISLVLPMRIMEFWQLLPPVAGLFLWLPFATSVAAGPLLFAFAALFPRRVWNRATVLLALVPSAVAVGWHLYTGFQISRAPGAATGLPHATPFIGAVNIVYAALAIGIFVVQRRRAETLTDRRRIGVLIVGYLIAASAGLGVVAGYWRNPGADIFASRTLAILSLLFLAAPASFAYAILRHRLFDVTLIVRQGLRYALARRFLDALIPLLGALLVIAFVTQSHRPVGQIIAAQWWWFVSLGVLLIVVRRERERWLDRLDRHFFRERYDAQRLLGSIVDQVNRATDFDAVAPVVLQQIEEALHPRFVSLLRHVPVEQRYVSACFVGSAEQAPISLPETLVAIGVIAVLRQPLALSLGDTAWVRHQLPEEERSLLASYGFELLVPISARSTGDRPAGVLAFGGRLSEEPYGHEDIELLGTIAQAVAVLLERMAEHRREAAECERCGRCFDSSARSCSDDGELVRPAGISLLLNGRYRLERRLGRGGMGVVYSALDEVLERTVAVKVIREDLPAPFDLPSRFRREARAAAGFTHPNVVRVYDFGLDRSVRPFLVMELLEGAMLRQRLAAGPLPASEALHVLRGVCAALSAAHERGLVHRDLKPENVFLHRQTTGVVPKVLDFGLAKAFHEPLLARQTTTADSSAGALVGTLEYMAPEQVAGDDPSPCWDVWAVSVMAYEMLTGRHPFRRMLAFWEAGVSEVEPAEPAAATSPLPDVAQAFFRHALSPDRHLRPQSASAFIADCERVLA